MDDFMATPPMCGWIGDLSLVPMFPREKSAHIARSCHFIASAVVFRLARRRCRPHVQSELPFTVLSCVIKPIRWMRGARWALRSRQRQHRRATLKEGIDAMKVRSSLKSLKRKVGSTIVRRRGKVFVLNKRNPRWKARQG